MQYETRACPLFSACGLHCGLCPRYYTAGPSRCPGCAGEGFSGVHPACGVLSCCQREGLQYCYQCIAFPCKKYDGAGVSDSFITHRNQLADMEKAKRIGMEAYKAELDEKVIILEHLLANYDDGRRKSFYCTAVNLLDLPSVRAIMEQAGEIEAEAPVKEKAKAVAALFEGKAAQTGISLKLRK